jgi:hypothetical protein
MRDAVDVYVIAASLIYVSVLIVYLRIRKS